MTARTIGNNRLIDGAKLDNLPADTNAELALKVDKTTTINGYNLSTNRTLTQDDIGDGTTYKQYSQTEKNKLAGIEAGAEVNNISDVNATDLTDGGDTSLHYHSADRNRSNHTGTQTASTISDFDTEVSNNTDVAANTSARHTHANKTILDQIANNPVETIVAGTNITVNRVGNSVTINSTGGGGLTAGQIIFDATVATSGGDYTSLSAAISAGKKTIFVRKGTYNESSTITNTTDGVVIIGESKRDTIIRFAVGIDGLVHYADNCYVSNLTLDGQTNNSGAVYVIGDGQTPGSEDLNIGNNNVIENCIIKGPNNTFAIYIAGPSYSVGNATLTGFNNNGLHTGNIVRNCELHSSWDGDAFSFSLQKNGAFDNNVCYGGRIAFYMPRSSSCSFNKVVSSANQGIFFAGPALDNTLVGNTIYNPVSSGIKLQNQLEHTPLLAGQGIFNNTISNNTITGAGVTGIEISGESANPIMENTFVGNTVNGAVDHCIYLQYSEKNTIKSNILKNPKKDGGGGRGSGIYLVANVKDNLFEGNIITGTAYHTAIGNREDNTCIGNIFKNNKIKGTNTERTIWIQSDECIIEGNSVEGGNYAGIRLDGASYCQVLGNKFKNNTNDANNSYAEIWVQNSGSNNLIANNTIRSTASNKANYGINIDGAGCNGNIIVKNKFNGMVSGNISDTGTGTELLTETNSYYLSRANHTGTQNFNTIAEISFNLPVTVGQSLVYDGTNWTNSNPTPAVGSARTLYLDPTATIADNLYLNTSPPSFPQTTKTASVDADVNGGIGFIERFVSGPLGRTDIPAGNWTFNTFASTSNNTGTDTIQIRVNKRVEMSGMTGTFTGAGTTRTFTVTGGTPFVPGDAGTILTASLIETPNQTAWISSYVSSSQVIVTLTDSGYVNESGVNLNAIYYLLFNSGETTDITGTSAVNYPKTTTQGAFTVNETDRLVTAYFAKTTSGTARTITLYYGGTTAYSNILTPLTTDHGDLGGLTHDDHPQYQTICSTQTVLTNYTFTGSELRDVAYGVDTSGGNVTININPDLFSTGREIVFCKLTNNTNTITFDAGAGNNIIGSQTYVISKYNETVILVKDGADTWKIKANFVNNTVDTSSTQTLTNKTFDDEFRVKQIATPSNPSAGYNKLYFKNDDKLYKLTSGGTETEIGAGGSNPIYETFIAGEQVVGRIARFTVKASQTIAGVKISLGTLPTGANFQVDVRRNGTATTNSIFTSDTPIEITTGQSATNGIYTTTKTTIDNGTCAENDVLYVYVSQIGSTLSGTDLQVIIY